MPTVDEKRRVLDAFNARRDEMAVAEHNGATRGTAWRVVNLGRAENIPRGGARASRTKMTQEIAATIESYVEENCTYSLKKMELMLALDLENRHLGVDDGKLFTVKHVGQDSMGGSYALLTLTSLYVYRCE